MLTATYSIVTISTEQNKTRRILQKLQHFIRNTWNNLQDIDLTRVESVFNNLAQFDKYFHTRKVEVYLIPAIRRVTCEADHLLAEIEALSANGAHILRSVREQLGKALEGGIIRVNDLRGSMDMYCSKLQKRLVREENELFPIAGRVLSVDEWFAVAEKFLADDARLRGRRRYIPPSLPMPAPVVLPAMAATAF